MAGTALAAVASACGGSDGGTPVDPEPPPPPEPPRAASITVSPASASLSFLGDTALFAAVVRDQYGAVFGASPTWTSSDTTVFTVGSAGIATAVGNGSGVVTASFQELIATATVEVAQLAASVELVAGGDQSARQGRVLRDSIVARVTDAGGAAVADAWVSFVPAEGDGAVAPDSVASDSTGLAATTWTLGDRPGAQQLTVSVAASDAPSVQVSATALTPEETVSALEVASGDAQRVRQGRVLGDSIVVRATDAEGQAVQGAVIVFAPADEHGAVAPDSVASDSTGLAATTWTLGDRPGAQQLTASAAAPGAPSVQVSATALTPEETVSALEVASGDGQQAEQGSELGEPVVVRATDAEGQAVEGAVIVFAPADGDGTAEPDSAATDSTGTAQTKWTLGDRPGNQRLVAAVAAPDGPSAQAGAVATRRRPNRPPEATQSLPTHVLTAGGRELTLRGPDHFEDPDGDPLSYTATTSDPSVVDVTWANGDFTLTTGSPGISQLVLAATDPSNRTAYVRFSAIVLQVPHDTNFDIDVVWIYPPSGPLNQALRRTVARWQQVISADIPNIRFRGQDTRCFGRSLRLYADVDDLVVFAVAADIDGESGVLARAGPCLIRTSNSLPLFGEIEFDASDVGRLSDENLFKLALHEMGHVLGIDGQLWSRFGLLQNPSLPDNAGADTHFSGPLAVAAFDDAANHRYTGARVPVENQAQLGSSDSHWRNSVFGTELMNPYLYINQSAPLSAVTIQSLADLGYQVDVSQADSYALPRAGLRARTGAPPQGAVSLGDDVRRGPVVVVGPDGRLVRVLRR